MCCNNGDKKNTTLKHGTNRDVLQLHVIIFIQFCVDSDPFASCSMSNPSRELELCEEQIQDEYKVCLVVYNIDNTCHVAI